MGQPGNVSRRNDIDDILHENALGHKQFISDKVFPPIFKDEQDGRYDVLEFTEIGTAATNDLAASNAASNEVSHEYTTDNYTTKERRLKEFSSDRDNKKMDSFDITIDDAKIVQYKMMVNKEKRVADIVFDTANAFSSYTTAVTTPWSTGATATPVKDVAEAMQAMIDQMNGMVDGSKIVGIGNAQARQDLVSSADIKDRWTGTGSKGSMANPTDEQLALALGLDEVWFSRIALAGTQIWSTDKFGIYLVSDSNQMKSAARVGNTIVWAPNSPSMWNASTWRNTDPDGQWTRVQTDSVEKLMLARAGHVLTNVD